MGNKNPLQETLPPLQGYTLIAGAGDFILPPTAEIAKFTSAFELSSWGIWTDAFEYNALRKLFNGVKLDDIPDLETARAAVLALAEVLRSDSTEDTGISISGTGQVLDNGIGNRVAKAVGADLAGK